MTLSMIEAMKLINEKKNRISLDELGFFLTVLRDNAVDDSVFEVLDKLVKDIFKICYDK